MLLMLVVNGIALKDGRELRRHVHELHKDPIKVSVSEGPMNFHVLNNVNANGLNVAQPEQEEREALPVAGQGCTCVLEHTEQLFLDL